MRPYIRPYDEVLNDFRPWWNSRIPTSSGLRLQMSPRPQQALGMQVLPFMPSL